MRSHSCIPQCDPQRDRGGIDFVLNKQCHCQSSFQCKLNHLSIDILWETYPYISYDIRQSDMGMISVLFDFWSILHLQYYNKNNIPCLGNRQDTIGPRESTIPGIHRGSVDIQSDHVSSVELSN